VGAQDGDVGIRCSSGCRLPCHCYWSSLPAGKGEWSVACCRSSLSVCACLSLLWTVDSVASDRTQQSACHSSRAVERRCEFPSHEQRCPLRPPLRSHCRSRPFAGTCVGSSVRISS